MQNKVNGCPIANVLYTEENKESRDKTKGELNVPDPPASQALAVLKGNQGKEDEPKDS